ncbi:MAG: hypothetical protein H0W11_02845 [Gemmatimonadetes bacterium]|nr:hypothetical protein [Gemmatimonadota bacterium]
MDEKPDSRSKPWRKWWRVAEGTNTGLSLARHARGLAGYVQDLLPIVSIAFGIFSSGVLGLLGIVEGRAHYLLAVVVLTVGTWLLGYAFARYLLKPFVLHLQKLEARVDSIASPVSVDVEHRISAPALVAPDGSEPRIAPAKDAGEETAASPAVTEDAPVNTSEERAALATEREQLQAQVVELEARLADVRAQHEKEKQALHGEIANLQMAQENRENWLRDAYWKLEYGDDRPVIPDLPEQQLAAERSRTQELRPALVRAADRCEAMLESLLSEMGTRDDATGLPWLADFIESQVLRRARTAQLSLDNALNHEQDIRCPLIGFCLNYYEARLWLIRLVRLLEPAPEVISAYERWREADRVFRSELERVLARNSLKAVRERVQHLVRQDAPDEAKRLASRSEAPPPEPDGKRDPER